MDRLPLLPIPTDPSLRDPDHAGRRGGNNPLLLVLTILGAKLATIAIVLWMAWTPQAGLFVAVTTWHWLVLLAALIALFEAYWERGSPLRFDGAPAGRLAGTIGADERQLLSLLVAGVTDKAIATQLRVSQRTVQRRIHDLMLLGGASTRMQLAWEASRLGWLGDEPSGLPHPVGA